MSNKLVKKNIGGEAWRAHLRHHAPRVPLIPTWTRASKAVGAIAGQ